MSYEVIISLIFLLLCWAVLAVVDTAVAGIAALLGGLSLKVSLPKGFDPVPLWCSEKYNDIYSNSEMHIVEGENHLIINKRKEVIGIILDFLSKALK